MRRYFIGLLALVGMTVLLIILLSGGGKKSTPPTPVKLPDYASLNTSVEMDIDGPINANQDHNTVQVIVSQSSATFNLIAGYDRDIVNSKVFYNTENSYTTLLYALYYSGFSSGLYAGKLNYGEQGHCPAGDRYIFSLNENGSAIQRYWSTSCSGGFMTYGGSVPRTIGIFQAQIPDYGELASGAHL